MLYILFITFHDIMKTEWNSGSIKEDRGLKKHNIMTLYTNQKAQLLVVATQP